MPWAVGARRFLLRTGMAALITSLLVAAFAAVYFSRAWAGRYLASGAWALGFFTLTPLMLKAFLFDHNPFAGMAWLGAKLAAMALALYGITPWAGEVRGPALGSALPAGVSTPLLVAGLRVAGRALHIVKPASATGAPRAVEHRS